LSDRIGSRDGRNSVSYSPIPILSGLSLHHKGIDHRMFSCTRNSVCRRSSRLEMGGSDAIELHGHSLNHPYDELNGDLSRITNRRVSHRRLSRSRGCRSRPHVLAAARMATSHGVLSATNVYVGACSSFHNSAGQSDSSSRGTGAEFEHTFHSTQLRERTSVARATEAMRFIEPLHCDEGCLGKRIEQEAAIAMHVGLHEVVMAEFSIGPSKKPKSRYVSQYSNLRRADGL